MLVERSRSPNPAAVERAAGLPFATKLLPPVLGAQEAVARPRLLDLLHGHLQKRATLLTAPAGYGKTTLLAQFAHQADALTCWCTLDEGDRDARTLLTYLVAAVARRVPDFGQGVLEALSVAGDAATQVRTAAGLFVTEVQERVRDFLLLIVDDCHVVAGSAESSLVLDLLLEHLPAHTHLILAGRSLPALSGLPRLSARRQVARAGQHVLRLDREETEAVVRLAGVTAAPVEQVEALEQQTQGWAMAVALIAASAAEQGTPLLSTARQGSPSSNGSGASGASGGSGGSAPARYRLPREARETLFGYLAAEVLAHQPPVVQSLLLGASVLPYVEVERGAALLGLPVDEVRRLLAAAETHAVFISRLESPPGDESLAAGLNRVSMEIGSNGHVGSDDSTDTERVYYRFHDLFRDFLQQSLREQQPVRYRWLQRRASALAEAAGDVQAAVTHALSGRHFARAARLIQAAAPGLIASGRWRTLSDWLHRFTDEALGRHEALLRYLVRAEFFLSRDDAQAERALQLAVAKSRPRTVLAAETQLLRGLTAEWRGDYRGATEAHQQALAEAEQLGVDELKTRARFELARCLVRRGELVNAGRLMQEVGKAGRLLNRTDWEALAHEGVASAELRIGRLDRALTELEQARATWDRVGNPIAQARTLNNLGLAQQHLGRVAEARKTFQEAALVAQRASAPSLEACVRLSLADLHRDTGEMELAQEAYLKAKQLLKGRPDPYLSRCALDGEGQLQRLRGQLDEAEVLARRAVGEAQAVGSQYEEALYTRSLGLVLFARREYAAAGQRLNDAATALETCEARRELARTRLYQLQLGYANRQRRALEETFQSLESLLAELGYSGFLLGDAGRARDVLAYGASMQWLGPRLSGLLSSVATAAEPQQAEVAEVAPQRAARSRQAQSAAEALPPVQAWALGPGKVRCGGRDITDLQWRSPKSKELFFYLLCNPGWQRRDQIVVDIWGEVSPAQARAGFHSNAHRLRRALHPDILQERHGRYQLNPHLSCWLDAAEFQDLSKELPGRAFSQRVATRGHEALQLYKGSFLEEFISSWVQQPRQQMESLFVDVAIWLGRFHALKGQHSRAIELAKRALAVQPYLEDAHELMIICHVAAGERAAALQQYLDYAALLEDDLDEAPSERMETLYRRIQDGGPVRLPVSGSVRTVSPRRRLGYGTQAALAATA